jgi:hypothetical protein
MARKYRSFKLFAGISQFSKAAERKTKRNMESLKNSGGYQYWSGSVVSEAASSSDVDELFTIVCSNVKLGLRGSSELVNHAPSKTESSALHKR